jgi:hypothetical protein
VRVLITNTSLTTRTGTETYVRDLAQGLLRRGHQPVVYSPRLGGLAQEMRAAGVPVVDDLGRMGAPPHLIHGHHGLTTLTAVQRFPGVPAVFVCHDRMAWYDRPPVFPRILRYVAVDENCRDRLVLECGLPPARVRVVHNWVDTRRFGYRGPAPAAPRRALVFTSYATDAGRLGVLRRVCAESGVALDVLGAEVGATPRPEETLREYDLVFAKARSALEAVAVGAAVILFGYDRMGPLVTEENWPRLRPLNLGMRAIPDEITEEGVRGELRRYEAGSVDRVARRVREEASLEPALDDLLGLYAEVLEEHRGYRSDPALEQQAVADYLAFLEAEYTRLTGHEKALMALRQSLGHILAGREAMPALPDEAVARLSLRVSGVPDTLGSGERAVVRVVVRNQGPTLLCSGPPHPIFIACRWSALDGADSLVKEGERSPLSPPLEPESETTYAAALAAPDEPGAYRLRVTLVQEGVRWLDASGHEGTWQDVPVVVT